ncbi:MAG: hypothetical protein JNJ53_06915 [Rhizobiales bacterium]|nr:hypothetical protein [Hyphomicrobiales bacterium]
MTRLILLALFLLQFAVAAWAEMLVPQLMGERLRAGELARLEQDLSQRLAAQPKDDQARFALGAAQFLRTVEGLAQGMYRYGLQAPRDMQRNLPFFRFPLPRNPAPEKLDYEKMRDVFKAALDGFVQTDATLAGLGDNDIKLPISIGLARLDLNGDGKVGEQEELWRVLDASLGGGNISQEQAERFIITFDRADAAWLRGYTNLLSALIEFMLAHDGKASFDVSAHMLFPEAGLPNAALEQQNRAPDQYFDMASIADVLAAIHLMHWEVREPERMKSALSHLEIMVAMSRESWRFILAEADDEAEWIPSPKQKNAVLTGIIVTQQTVDGWMAVLDEFSAILAGKKLVPHWRLDKGINLRRAMLEEKVFDPILWVQGSAALPFLEDGPVTETQTWDRIMTMLQGNFLGYAVWFN